MSGVKTVSETHTREAQCRNFTNGKTSHQVITITAVQTPCDCYECCGTTEGNPTTEWFITKTKHFLTPGEPREEVCKDVRMATVTRSCDGDVTVSISRQATKGDASGGCRDHITRTIEAAMTAEPMAMPLS